MEIKNSYYFGSVSLLITHYNRSKSLHRLLAAMQNLNVTFGEIVISDDGSSYAHLQNLLEYQKIFNFRLITAPVNKGLPNNINKGQDAVLKPYTLYVQEDFVPSEIFPIKFQHSLEIMDERPDIDIARYWAYWKYPYLQSIRNGFSEMKFSIWKLGYKKFYVYSDASHLRRSNFFQKFGKFLENLPSDRAEYLMMMSFIRHNGKAIYNDNYNDMFDHRNSDDEPSTVERDFISYSEGNPVITIIRNLYRNVKFNLDYLFLFTWRFEKLIKALKAFGK
jgi:glycosyltransferase involved in cell wall biosynthesis